MCIVRIGRVTSKEPMQFSFDSTMEAFNFYVEAKESYREDDLVIDIIEEGETE